MSIRTKLLGGFMIVVVLLVAVFGVAYNGLNNISNEKDEIVKQDHIAVALEKLDYESVTSFFLTQDMASLAGTPQFDFYKEKVDEHNAIYDGLIDTLRGLVSSDQLVILNEIAEHAKAQNEQVSANNGNIDMAAMAANNEASNASKARLKESATASMAAAQKSADDAKSSAITITVIMAAIAAALAVAIGFFLSRSISNGTRQMIDAANRIADEDLASFAETTAAMAEGDLSQSVNIQTQELNITSKDEIGQLGQAFNKMIARLHDAGNSLSKTGENLGELIGKISHNSEQLNAASDQLSLSSDQVGAVTQQVASTSQQMAKGAGDQAASSQETAKAVEQLTGVAQQIASGAAEQSEGVRKASLAISEVSAGANQVATNAATAANGSKVAAEAAKEGASRALQTVEGMKRIQTRVEAASQKVSDLGQQSEEIGKIVAVIDDIAAQTNLLALNAAIEAARAGEHGRGFAVVSDEVRKLAERTAGATKEIASLIGTVQSGVGEAVSAMEEGTGEVTEGFKLASEAGDSLEAILKASNDVSQQIEQISSAAQQMSTSANEMVQVIDSVGSITEENTAAAVQMKGNAQEVAQSVETIAGVAEQNSAATEQVSASAEEMSAQMQEVVASSQSLKQMADDLQEAISIFNVNGRRAIREINLNQDVLRENDPLFEEQALATP